jgi:hypothetical protein
MIVHDCIKDTLKGNVIHPQLLINYNIEKPFLLRNLITIFRIRAYQLRIETGRYERKKNQAGKISILEREERVFL